MVKILRWIENIFFVIGGLFPDESLISEILFDVADFIDDLAMPIDPEFQKTLIESLNDV